jgi:hypothetical protein
MSGWQRGDKTYLTMTLSVIPDFVKITPCPTDIHGHLVIAL